MLAPTSSAARLLHYQHIGRGWCAGPEFPGATVRHAIDKLIRLGYWDYTLENRVTPSGRAYLDAHHLSIKE